MPGKLFATVLLTSALTLPALAQSTVPAIFLSDIHLDPYHDPAKVARLNEAPVSEWSAILAAPGSDPHSPAITKLQLTCPVRGTDTPNAVWQSSLRALRTQATTAHPKFVTISGDLLAHQFDCKFHALLPKATHEQYVAFTEKTVRYVLTSLKAAIPDAPIYVALGNNDTACTDYQLAPAHDEFLGVVAKVAAEVLPAADRPALLSSYPESGSFSAPLAGVPDTRIIVLDDLFLSASYGECGGAKNSTAATAQIAWLRAQLSDAREQGQRVWVMGHIPPSVDVYNTARRLTDVCANGRPVMFLGSDDLRETLAEYADVIRLALFGHTHNDEIAFIASRPPESSATAATAAGIPVKITASITPVNGNKPTFTVVRIDPQTATLKDFTVFEASNLTGINTTWTKEYTYSTAYHQQAFDGPSVSTLIAGFQADPKAETEASEAYLKNFFPGDISALIRFVWPEYACSMNNQTQQGLAACVCHTAGQK